MRRIPIAESVVAQADTAERSGSDPVGGVRHENRVSPGALIICCILLSLAAWPTLGRAFAGFGAVHPGLDHDIERATQLVADNPNQADSLVKRGHLYRLNGRLVESLADLDRARQLDPQDRWVGLQRGLTLSAMGRDQEAEAELDRFLRGGPGTLAYTERGRIRARTGRTLLAIADLTSAIGMRPDVDSYLLRGRLQVSLGLLAEAVAGYREGWSRLGGAFLLE